MRQLRVEMRAQLHQHVEPAYATKIRELVHTKMELLGVRVPVVRALVRPFVASHPAINVDVACALYGHCCTRPCREELLFAQAILERFRKKLPTAAWTQIDSWIDVIDNWEVCDQLSKNIAAELIHRDPALSKHLHALVRSTNPWRRRFALAASTSLNQGGRRQVQLALDLCEPLMREPVLIVQKAVGWALREAARHDPAAVAQFLERHHKGALPRILREAGVPARLQTPA